MYSVKSGYRFLTKEKSGSLNNTQAQTGTELGSQVRGGHSIKRKYYEILRKKKIEKVLKFQLVLTNCQQRQKHNY